MSISNQFANISKLATYSTWKGQQSSIVLARKGFSYSGQNCVIKCDVCEAAVDMETNDVINLSNEHAESCRIRQLFQPKPSNQCEQSQRVLTSRQTQHLPEACLVDINIYPSVASIMGAPSDECPCSSCSRSKIFLPAQDTQRDMHGLPRLIGKRLILKMKRRIEENNGPIHSQFEDEAHRRQSFDLHDINNGIQAEAGFFSMVERKEDRVCFYCDGCLRKEVLTMDPWREHARWFPVCPHVLQKKGGGFVHDVLHDTKILKRHLKGLNRPTKMETCIVVDALDAGYHRCLIKETIQGFFHEYGSFPNSEEMFGSLESIRDWKTFP
ncbi:E3 ubiquitin-protein ligase XIAP-like [Mytilus edulis]|uniref:E3 ubiquitin-protein ligase XIAP-like n=1 Tax=Mytilus edulis TaxID=6550 RepID=UPI0039EE3BDC